MEKQVLPAMEAASGYSDKKISRTIEYLILQWQLHIGASIMFLY